MHDGVVRDWAKHGTLYWLKSEREQAEVHYEPVEWDDQFGYICFDNSSLDNTLDKNIKIKYEVFPVPRAKKTNTFLRLEFRKERFAFVKTIKPTIMRGESDIECDEKDVNTEEFCMKVPQIYLSKFMDAEQDLELNYECFEIE